MSAAEDVDADVGELLEPIRVVCERSAHHFDATYVHETCPHCGAGWTHTAKDYFAAVAVLEAFEREADKLPEDEPTVAELARRYSADDLIDIKLTAARPRQVLRECGAHEEAGYLGAWSDCAAAAAEVAVLKVARHEAMPDEVRTLGDSRVDWSTFWTRDHQGEAWTVEPVLAHGRGHAIVAGAKVGKSELLLACAAGAATGTPVLGRPAGEPITVVYVDLEMTEDDLFDRLTELGYDETSDLGRLHHLLLPNLPPLDTAAGGAMLAAYAVEHEAELVIIDTLTRAVEGPENEADTLRDFARHTGTPLKRAGITWIRADHAGKDPTKGGRGTSAKTEDVDVVWQMTRSDDGVALKATHRRVSWVPEVVNVRRAFTPELTFTIEQSGWPAGTAALANLLNTLDVPVDAGERIARTALKDAGHRVANASLRAAIKYRRRRSDDLIEVTP